MTDTHGATHRYTLPQGLMRPSIRDVQHLLADALLPRPFVELVTKTTNPFIQVVTDVASPQASFCDGKVLLVGDALCGFRPHAASATAQGAFDASLLGKVMTGQVPLAAWEKTVLGYAAKVGAMSKAMGEKAQFGVGEASAAGAGSS